MKNEALRLLAFCTVAAAALSGCASSSSSPSSSQASAASRSTVQSGSVASVESAAGMSSASTGTTSGTSSASSTASGSPALITVKFADGTEGRYIVDRPAKPHKVGEAVYVITQGEQTAIISK